MQTFLPHRSFFKSADYLDNLRLNKQILEVKQILRASLGYTKGWTNHPIVKMWRGYEAGLITFGIACCETFRIRNKKEHSVEEYLRDFIGRVGSEDLINPPWLSDETITNQYRANLLYKDYDHYSQFNWNVQPDATRIYFVNGEYVYKK
jgi:hypothetical protein